MKTIQGPQLGIVKCAEPSDQSHPLPAGICAGSEACARRALVNINKPIVRARCEFAEVETPGLAAELERLLARLKPGR